jgi:type I restriction-modification system DNA methylase subunit/REP element-mobilizing transposase RayT
LFGVDLNEESTEITKLALWLKTAKKDQPLQNLDNNIKCGNSLIDDPKIAGDKAFNWNNEFKDIFKEKELKAFHITWATHNSRYSERMAEYKVKSGKPVLLDEKDETLITEFIAQIVKEDELRVLAYNICHDHIHLVLVCADIERDNIVCKLKSISARKYNIQTGITVPAATDDVALDGETCRNPDTVFNNTAADNIILNKGACPLAQAGETKEKTRTMETRATAEKKETRGETQNHLWVQKYNYNLIETEEELANVINYVSHNRLKHNLPENKGACPLVDMLTPPDKAFEPQYEGGFDIIIGNPPYGAELNEEEKIYCKNKYSNVLLRSIDSYNFFISKSLEILKENGLLAFIVPNTLLFQPEYKKTRELILTNFVIHRIINLGDSIFENADVPTCIFIVKKTQNINNYDFGYVDLRKDKGNLIINLEKNMEINNVELILNNESLIFGINTKTNDLMNKANINAYKIDSIASDVSYGLTTGNNQVFIIDDKIRIEQHLENDLLKKIISSENINKYILRYNSDSVIYTQRDTIITNYPNLLNYLLPYKDKLEQRSEPKKGIAPWFSLHRQRYKELFNDEKLILRQTGDSIIATYDNSGYFALDNTMCVKLNPEYKFNYKYVLALLNSKLFDLIYKNLSQEDGRAFAQVKPTNIRKLPIYKATKEQQKSLADKAEKMIQLNKNMHEQTQSALNLLTAEYSLSKISQKLKKFYSLGNNIFIEELQKQTKTKLSLSQKEELLSYYGEKSKLLNDLKNQINDLDKTIDQEVYKLYDLTDEEIKIIEGE